MLPRETAAEERAPRPAKLDAIKASFDRGKARVRRASASTTAEPEPDADARGPEMRDDDGLEHHGTVGRAIALASSPDGRWIATACSDHAVWVISPLSREVLVPPLVLEGHRRSITALAFGDGPRLASASIDGVVLSWDLMAGRQQHAFSFDTTTHATALALDANDLLAAGTAHGDLYVWRTTESFPLVARVQAHPFGVTALAFAGRDLLATGSRDGTIKLWRLPQLALLATFVSLPEGWVAFAPDGRYKAAGRVAGEFSHVIGECRFAVGELDEHILGLRLAADELLFDPLLEG